MGLTAPLHQSGQRIILLTPTVITTAVTGVTTTPVTKLSGMWQFTAEGIFVYGSGGTTVKAWIQTSVDGGTTWFDIMNFAYTTATLNKVGGASVSAGLTPATPTDATLADNTVNQGILGDRLRLKYTSTGTYGGSSSLAVYVIAKG